MENYLLVNNYGKSNTPDRIYYIMTRSDLPNLIKEESVVFGDKAYILEEGTMMFMGNDGIWYDTEGEVPVITAKELNVTENGTYIDSDPYVAYRPVNVQVTDYNVEGLNVTENGTYSESGKAYSPVVVNVPLPENAYLKKDLPTGAIATVTDAETEFMPSLKVAITPVQSGSGDPSPDNIRPISGWTGCNVCRTGKNLVDETQTLLAGALNANGSAYGISSNYNKHTYKIPIKGGVTYTYSAKKAHSAADRMCCWYGANGAVVGSFELPRYRKSVSAIAPSNAVAVSLTIYNTTGQEIQLEVGNTATSHEPYTGTTYPITFPSEAGTVYGGTLDVTNGTLTVNRKLFNTKDTSWSSYNGVFYIQSWSERTNTSVRPIAEQYVTGPNANGMGSTSGWDDQSIRQNTSGNSIYIKDSRFSSVRDFKNNANVNFVYSLATPVTYQLTPTEVQMLLGTNNIWADTGDILEGKYWSKNPVTVTQAMLSTLRGVREITEITPEEPEEPEELEEPEENDER